MKVTEQAAEQLKIVLADFDKPGSGIHIYSTSGCCGTSIQIDIATHLETNETVVSIDGIDFFIANSLIPTLANVTIEYNSNGFLLSGLKKSGGCCS